MRSKKPCGSSSSVMLCFGPDSWPKSVSSDKLSKLRRASSIFLLCAASAIASPAQILTTLINFDGTNGANPSSLVQGTDGNLWGTTLKGGKNQCGTVFKMSPGGVLIKSWTFDCTNGNEPGGLILGTDGSFYGTGGGGSNGDGTIFRLKPGADGLTMLFSFDYNDGNAPVGNLTEGADGNFYGVTYSGGSQAGYGTVFKITPTGTLTTLYVFDFTHGALPYAGPIQGTNGDFYGTTSAGGAYAQGTVYRITSEGALTVLHSFGEHSGDGMSPVTSLIQGKDGNFYGVTIYGGGGPDGDGTVFKITPSGVFTNLHNFNRTDGQFPESLLQASDGHFYGVTTVGGPDNFGTVFKITRSGVFTNLHNFDGTDGEYPQPLMQGSDGYFYGTTGNGGANGEGTIFKMNAAGEMTTLSLGGTEGPTAFVSVQNTDGTLYGLTSSAGTSSDGTIFSLKIGANPFCLLEETSGTEGTKVNILGQGFSSSSLVKFGGTSATTIVRTGKTFITATVPAGALTGAVTVATGATTLTSTKTFKVQPTVASFSPPSGPVGTAVTIKGSGLEQATKVTFDGKSASFTATSDSEVTADVPTGALTGKIAITTKGGSASSATSFTVN
jgi:uncharacterized repeat protein (TIGR03803 family)